MQPFDDSMQTGTCSRIRSEQYGVHSYLGGTVVTAYGIVDVRSDSEYTRMDFAINGRMFMRSWKCGFTQRGLAILAGKFAKEKSK